MGFLHTVFELVKHRIFVGKLRNSMKGYLHTIHQINRAGSGYGSARSIFQPGFCDHLGLVRAYVES